MEQHAAGDQANQHPGRHQAWHFVTPPVQDTRFGFNLFNGNQHGARLFHVQHIVESGDRHFDQRRKFIDSLRTVFHFQRQRLVHRLQQGRGVTG